MNQGTQIVLLLTALASQYSPHTMESVVAIRQDQELLPQVLPSVDGYIAVLDCSLIGQTWHLRPQGTPTWEQFLIADCANPLDGGDTWMVDHNIIAEVDYKTAVRWNTVGSLLAVERGIEVERGIPK